MNRVLAAAPVAVICFVAVLALAALTLRAGLVPADGLSLWAGAIAAGDGELPFGRIIAAYPTIPFLATTLLQFALPAATPAPSLLAALILACIAGLWFLAFRDRGVRVAGAMVVTLLIVLHPALLRAAVTGPADMCLAAFLFLLAKGLYDLRAQSTASEIMTVALALLGLSFSHPMGAAIAVASVPFLVLSVRPALIANSALNVIVALIFPAVFCIFSFVYVSWVFPGSGWSFFTAPAASLAVWGADKSRFLGGAMSGLATLDAGLAVALAFVLGAPAAVVAVVMIRRRQPLVAPALVFAAAVIAAAMITVATGLFGEPVSVVVAAPILAAIVLIRVPGIRERLPTVIALLALGWIGGAAELFVVDPSVTRHISELLQGAPADREKIDALNLGQETARRDGVLIDAFNAPAVVIGRGAARGLLAPQGDAFAMTMLFARIDAPFVAVPDPESAGGAQDQLNKTFPKLYRFGVSGYRLVYQNTTWRLFERISRTQVSNP